MSHAIRALAVLALAGTLVLAGCGKDSVSDRQFGEKVRAYLLAHPEVLRETAEALDKKDAKDKSDRATAVIRADRVKLERDPRDLVLNPNGKVTVVQFFDYNCGYCKQAAPELLAMAKARPNVRFVFKDWPVVGGEESVHAARIAYGVRQSHGNAAQFYADLIGARPANRASLQVIAAARGLDLNGLQAAADKGDFDRYQKDTGKLAHDLGLEGTPAFVVGDEMFEGSDIERLKAAIAKAKA
ncbi:MAG TPA: DsbA family protein [Caulobacteraceae bacterium]|nr:DsbA family protein [Caulobacteraceae bacterium]